MVCADVPTQECSSLTHLSSIPLFQNNNLTTQDHESIIVVSTFLSKAEDKSILFDNSSVSACLCPSEVGQVWKLSLGRNQNHLSIFCVALSFLLPCFIDESQKSFLVSLCETAQHVEC